MTIKLSQKGIATLNYLEGCPLKAYRDVAGVITIGAGLTAASGVIVPKLGMTITQDEADRLLQKALEQKYIPAVCKVLGTNQPQNVIDGAVSFHYNTGAIARASWVQKFKAGDVKGARAALALQNKSKGKVIKGLERRRAIEADMIILGKYPDVPQTIAGTTANKDVYATLALAISVQDIKKIQKDFESLGYAVTAGLNFHKDAVVDFQCDNSLKADGIIGKATLSTLQRPVDARKKSKVGASAALLTAAAGTGDASYSGFNSWGTWAGYGAAIISLIYISYLVWSYRDVIASKIAPFMPNFANWLRSR